MASKPRPLLVRRLAWGAGIVAAVWFTLGGGEYGTLDLWQQRGRRAALDAEVAQLRLDVDSLQRELKAFRTDDAKLERLAREKYGMVKGGKELLYWVGNGTKPTGDSAALAADSSGKRPP
ncbi:MAG: septum formation initiator family protein [Gemmatimonadaceae bacterium]|nr:septum formation initiator family protein [Gemmatimonadaceae bacterium]